MLNHVIAFLGHDSTGMKGYMDVSWRKRECNIVLPSMVIISCYIVCTSLLQLQTHAALCVYSVALFTIIFYGIYAPYYYAISRH